jgi:hypothetical protein
MLPRGGSGAPPPPPLPPPPQDQAPTQGEKEEDSGEFLAQLPTDAEAEEAAAKQKAILASFETQRRDRAA